jgi:hypothetical protein
VTVRNTTIGILALLHAVACFDLWNTIGANPLPTQANGLLLMFAVVFQVSTALYLAIIVRGHALQNPVAGPFIRLALYTLVSAVLLTSIFTGLTWLDRSVARVFFLVLLAGGWTICCISASRPGTSPRWRRVADIVVANVVIGILLLEGGLLIISRIAPSRIFFDPTSAASMIDVWRVKPHATGFGFRYSSLGYHDEEFFVASDNDLVVALLADSFGVGIVPYPYNFATVAETRLRSSLQDQYDRIAIHNFGVPATGMREYLHLLKEEALGYNPTRVVLCVFVGNDIDGIQNLSRRQRYLVQDWLISNYVARAQSLYRNLRAEGRGLTDLADLVGMKTLGSAVANEDQDNNSPSVTAEIPDHIHDWTKEPPHLDRSTFLHWEAKRLTVCDTENDETGSKYRDFFDALSRFDKALGDRLLVLLIPDQFQLEDDLWNELLLGLDRPEAYDRDYPQTRIGEFCDQHDIAYLDPLPLLREHQREGRTYHLRDTHWNARGNRIAGEALAERLITDLGLRN